MVRTCKCEFSNLTICFILFVLVILLGQWLSLKVYERPEHLPDIAVGPALIYNQNDRTAVFRSIRGILKVSLGVKAVSAWPSVVQADNASLELVWSSCRTSLRIKWQRDSSYNGWKYQIQWESTQMKSLVDDILFEPGTFVYGGAEATHQYWPANTGEWKMAPFVTGRALTEQYGDVQERFWISNNGFAVTVPNDIPLHVSLNESGTCLLVLNAAKIGTIFDMCRDVIPKDPLRLSYVIWISADDTLKEFYLRAVKSLFNVPDSIPSSMIFTYPIWNTWAFYANNISQWKIEDYVRQMRKYGLAASQISIDDRWSTLHGDIEFDPERFPAPRSFTRTLSENGYSISLWVHPYVNNDSITGQDPHMRKYFLKDISNRPIEVDWGNGRAFLIDVTNPAAVDWWFLRLSQFKRKFGIDTYKFDAGEVTGWFPSSFKLAEGCYPNLYSEKYAAFAALFGGRVEVRLGTGTQQLGLWVRLYDRHSHWGYDNGLKSVIPSALQLSILGYPFIIPDLIGGNSYFNSPDKELYIRWMQAVTLFPSMQFSIPPWIYDNETVTIAYDMISLHERFSNVTKELAKQFLVTQEPILRPLWWLEDTEESFLCDTQYLLGDDIMVAPVLEPNSTSREIYIPIGSWRNSLDGSITQGPSRIVASIKLNQLAIFYRE